MTSLAGRLILFAVLLFFVTLCSLPATPTAQAFRCSAGATCRSLLGYKPRNATTLSAVQTLFGVKNLRILLGANGLDAATSPNATVAAQQVIRVPIPCACLNGTGVSNKVPVYTVQPGDGLSVIASSTFMGLVKYERIVAVNKQITDPNVIDIGERLWVPLPCSCEDVAGEKVVHYTHVVEAGSTVEGIAQEFGTTNDTLYMLNGITSNRQLIADEPIDVPLRACNSSIRSDAIDSQLLVANGTYVFTAHNCVQCKCDSANNWTLQCQASGVRPSDWSTCPAMQCGEGNNAAMLGNTSTSACRGATCAYGGFSANQTIFTTFDRVCSAAPAPGPASGGLMKNWNMVLLGLVHLIVLQMVCIGG